MWRHVRMTFLLEYVWFHSRCLGKRCLLKSDWNTWAHLHKLSDCKIGLSGDYLYDIISRYIVRGHTLRMTAIFGPFLTPSPLWTQNDVIVTNTDRIWLTPLPPRMRSSLKYPPKPTNDHITTSVLSQWNTAMSNSYTTHRVAKAWFLAMAKESDNRWHSIHDISPLTQQREFWGYSRSGLNSTYMHPLT